jgi:hypothetical protein
VLGPRKLRQMGNTPQIFRCYSELSEVSCLAARHAAMLAPDWWMLLKRTVDFFMGASFVNQIVLFPGAEQKSGRRGRFANFWWTTAADAVDLQ